MIESVTPATLKVHLVTACLKAIDTQRKLISFGPMG